MPVIKSIKINKRDPVLLKWRQMVTKNLRLLRQGPNTQLLPLQFARYKVKKEDELWHIISATALNVDTLAQINQLSSIHDVKEGDWLLIPNMRGVFRQVSAQTKVQDFLRKWGISRSHLYSANKYAYIINNKRFIFVPGGELTSL